MNKMKTMITILNSNKYPYSFKGKCDSLQTIL